MTKKREAELRGLLLAELKAMKQRLVRAERLLKMVLEEARRG